MKVFDSNVLQLLEFYIYHRNPEGNIVEGRYGINVAKVQEVRRLPLLTQMPNIDSFVSGVFDLRGKVILCIDLAQYMNLDEVHQSSNKKVIITEFSNVSLGIIIHNANRILNVPYKDVESPPDMIKEKYNNDIVGLAKVKTEDIDDYDEFGEKEEAVNNEELMILIVDFESIATKIGLIKDPPARSDEIKESIDKGTIFIVDDSAIARKQMKGALTTAGFEVIEAIDGEDAWNRINEFYLEYGDRIIDKFQLVVSDVEMPKMDGLSLTKKIKNDTRFKKIPIIIHSSMSGEANIAKGTKVGADDYIVKFDPLEFLEKVEKYKLKL